MAEARPNKTQPTTMKTYRESRNHPGRSPAEEAAAADDEELSG
jgi:hypothetical protein